MKFFGRTKEIGILQDIRARADATAQFTVVTGRRRVEKTELIRKALDEIKLDLQRYSPAELERKRDVFLRSTGEYADWQCACRALSLTDV